MRKASWHLWQRLPRACSARWQLAAVRVCFWVFRACTKLPSASHQSWFSPEKTNFDATLVRVCTDARCCAYNASGLRESRAMLHEGRACRLHLGLIGSLRLSVPPRWGSTPFPHFRREYAASTFRCRTITPHHLGDYALTPYCLAISLSILPFAAPSIGQLITTPHIHFQLACPL